ncbi:type I-B CRISPR-associated protein Cas7/Cst2/DevR [Caldisalinibacter kiritimatiensis]|uniref:CRISPR-associated negative autoregulator n=1 Tax=Caldisalinibacter kiritimatiensis TaxID=1304284 RepID=R1CT47_9FIRM|nr:type I-B CRISPR-associated protein Cas7/Cst2/DevR [Caldisalinibacter kiritimatiensis]EOD01821.1 CRISPR-associated negative autoregulator [Caldisalinibacter kiritimatiensis]
MKKGLTVTVIFQGDSLNYGEGIGNISELKKLNRGNGNTHTFASRQSLRYDIVRLGNNLYDWNLDTVVKNGTIQFKKDCTIRDSEEMDLFGYMKTKGNSNAITRSAPVRLSHAISLEPYRSDMDFLNNKGLADRIGENPNLANIEQHQSFYTYTVTIDLDKVGKDKDGKEDIVLEKEERTKRVNQLLTILKVLNRNIRGRQENLSPLFIIGGIYDIPNPFFQGRIKLETKGGEFYINTEILEKTLEITLLDKSIKENTFVGIVDGIFNNKSELETLLPEKVLSVEKFFKTLETEIDNVYKVEG